MEFKLPDIGEGIHEGEITKWLVKDGDTLSPDQPMVEVMTDKATVEIPSPVGGVVEALLAKEGETVLVGKAIIRIRETGKKAASLTPEKAPEKKAPQEKPLDAEEKKLPLQPVEQRRDEEVIPFHILATPATRKLARELGVLLREVKGTGLQGRVTKLDVQMAFEGREAAVPRTSHPIAVSLKPIDRAPKALVVSKGEIQRVPLKGIRKRIAEAMTTSIHKAAHFTFVEELDMSEVVSLRETALDEAKERGLKLTYLPFIIKAIIPALKDFPYFNASLDDERQEIVLRGDYNVGIATDTPNGLLVPVIKNADQKSIWDLSKEISELSERARQGRNHIDELRGSTFTITNAGSLGGVFATPIINYPEVAILGVNSIRKRPVVKEDAIVIRHMMFLSLSVDHRVLDGADAARFMNRLVFYLSSPNRLVFV